MRVMTASADRAFAARVRRHLRRRATLHEEAGAEAALLAAREFAFDAIIVDRTDPATTALGLLRQLRERGISTPLLMIGSGEGAAWRTEAYTAGADDVVDRAFDGDELLARIGTLVRRRDGHSQPVVTVGLVTVDLERREAAVRGQVASLTAREFDVLALLASRAGRVLSRELFLDHLYREHDEPEIRIIDVFVCKMRRKIDRLGGAGHVATVHGVGYVLQDPSRSPGA